MRRFRPARSYEKFKGLLADKDGNLSVPARLAAGAGAACVSTIVRAERAARSCTRAHCLLAVLSHLKATPVAA